MDVLRTSDHEFEEFVVLPAGSEPVDVTVVRPGGTGSEIAFVANRGAHSVSRIDVATLAVIPGDIELGPGVPPVAIAARSDGGLLFTADSTNSTVSVIDITLLPPALPEKIGEMLTHGDASRLFLLRVP